MQLLATVLVMAAASPFILDGAKAANKAHDHAAAEKAPVAKAKQTHRSRKRKQPEPHDDEAVDNDEGSVTADDKPEPVAGQTFLATHAPSLLPLWLALVSLYGAWMMVELAVSTLWREHNDQLSEALGHAVGLVPGPHIPFDPPRVRLDIKGIVVRLWRQLLGALVFASGAPFFLLAYLAPRIGPALYAVVLALWGAYWLLVTTAAKSESAWREGPRRTPWFLAAWGRLTGKVPGFRWFAPRAYGSLWHGVTVKMHGATELFETRPYAFAGLAVVRLVGNLPVLSMLIRPLMPVAAELVTRDERLQPAQSIENVKAETGP